MSELLKENQDNVPNNEPSLTLSEKLDSSTRLKNEPSATKKTFLEEKQSFSATKSDKLNYSTTLNNERVKILSAVITKERGLPEKNTDLPEHPEVTSKGKQTLKDMFGSDLNKETSDMLDDIVGSFEGLLSNNPSKSLGGIMEISQKITSKYSDKINKGDIQLDKLMEAISKKVPGLEKMLGGMKDIMKTKDEKPKEKIIIDENFSTATIDVGEMKEDTGSGMKIGNMLKMAQNFGVLGGSKSAEQSADSIPHMGKMIEIMQRLEKASSPEDTAAIKKEMDEFLQNEMGVDVSQINNQLEEITQQMVNDESNTDNK